MSEANRAHNGSTPEEASSPSANAGGGAARIRVMPDSSEERASTGESHQGKLARKERRRKFGWASLSYTARVTLAFALIAAMTGLVAIGVISFVWEQHFQTYTASNMETLAETTASRIEERMEADSTLTIKSAAALMPVEAALEVTPGIAIKVVDENDVAVFDSSNRINGIPNATSSLEPKDASKVALAKIVVDDKVVGSVRIWVYGSDTLMRGPDQEFRENSYQAMLFASLVAIVLASCIGFLFARGLVRPINRITKTAQEIKEGNLSARVNLDGKDEIAELAKTFDAMAESVESNQELERRLTTDVAHELRTPLMAIQSTVEAIMDGVFEADEERLNTIDAEVQRLSRLVDAILKLSRLESRSTPMNEEVVDVGDLIRPLVMSHEAFVNDAGLTLEYDAEPDVIVYGDRDMLRQATANLISNAVRYTPAPGKITVSVKRGDVMAAIAVRDTGIGLSPEERRMVFKRFWRAEESRQRQSGGLGVGLAVVKEIVDRHGGWVQVEGKKGEGACFTIHVPLYDEERIKAQKEKANSKERGAKAQAAKRKGRN